MLWLAFAYGLVWGTATFIENAEPEFLRQVSQWQTTCITGSASER